MGTTGRNMPATVEREVVPAPASFHGSAEIVKLNRVARGLELEEQLPPDALPKEIEAFREKLKTQI